MCKLRVNTKCAHYSDETLWVRLYILIRGKVLILRGDLSTLIWEMFFRFKLTDIQLQHTSVHRKTASHVDLINSESLMVVIYLFIFWIASFLLNPRSQTFFLFFSDLCSCREFVFVCMNCSFQSWDWESLLK